MSTESDYSIRTSINECTEKVNSLKGNIYYLLIFISLSCIMIASGLVIVPILFFTMIFLISSVLLVKDIDKVKISCIPSTTSTTFSV